MVPLLPPRPGMSSLRVLLQVLIPTSRRHHQGFDRLDVGDIPRRPAPGTGEHLAA
jgi:hypothetical protein